MVMNSWKADGTVNVPWLHPVVAAHVTAAIKLRYTLMPYLWALFERANSNHEPIIRPTFYDFPEDERCFVVGDKFMLGRELLVAPVVEQGSGRRSVNLPAGPQAWFDFQSGVRMAAGQVHVVDAPWATLPLFAHAGAAIPLAGTSSGRSPRHDDPVSDRRIFAG